MRSWLTRTPPTASPVPSRQAQRRPGNLGSPGAAGSFPTQLTNVNGTLFFRANDGIHGEELWKSDGTAAGTMMVKDLNPGAGSSSPGSLTNVNGTLYFAAANGINGVELWKSNGTQAGTVLVKDINAGGSSSPQYLTNVNGTLFFAADDGVNGSELWKSNGTAAGTVLVKDINPGSSYGFPSDSSPSVLTAVGGPVVARADGYWVSPQTVRS